MIYCYALGSVFKHLTCVMEHYGGLFTLRWVIAKKKSLLSIIGLYFFVIEGWYHWTAIKTSSVFSSDGLIAVTKEPCDPCPRHKTVLYKMQDPRNGQNKQKKRPSSLWRSAAFHFQQDSKSNLIQTKITSKRVAAVHLWPFRKLCWRGEGLEC